MAELRDYIKVKHGFAFKGDHITTNDNGIVLVTPGNFSISGGFKEEKCKFFDGEYPTDYVLRPGDLIVTMTDLSKAIDTLGHSALVPKSERTYLHNQRIGLVKIIDEKRLDKHYLYWFMRTSYYQKTIAATSSGSTVHHTSPDRIMDVEIELPDLEKQRAVATFMDNIESKINTNKQINKNLEQQTVLLFKKSFIEFDNSSKNMLETRFGLVPESFKLLKNGELPLVVTDYVANGSFASLKANVTLYQEPNYAYFIRNTDLKSGTFEVFVDEHSYNFLSKSTLYGGEIIISNVGDVGSVFLCPKLDKPMTLGNNIIMLRPEQENLRYYLYIWFKWLYGQSLIQGIKGGSAQPKFNKTDFKNLPIFLPPDDLLEQFHQIVKPMFELIDENNMENQALTRTRDTILPRLMSGELDVSDVEI